jgi:ElaB/YqjD/DUF883 family membrane-anchored ribosome-binding protein
MARNVRESKEKLVNDFQSVIADTEELMKFVSNESGGKAQALRDKLDHNLKLAKDYLRDVEGSVVDKSKVAAKVTDEYVHENAWRTVGLAIGVGILIGFLIRDRD